MYMQRPKNVHVKTWKMYMKRPEKCTWKDLKNVHAKTWKMYKIKKTFLDLCHSFI